MPIPSLKYLWANIHLAFSSSLTHTPSGNMSTNEKTLESVSGQMLVTREREIHGTFPLSSQRKKNKLFIFILALGCKKTTKVTENLN